MAAFLGLFRRWLDPSNGDNNNSDNNNNQQQPTPGEESTEDRRSSEMMLRFQLEMKERVIVLQNEVRRLKTELQIAEDEKTAAQIQHMYTVDTKESDSKRVSSELKAQIDALNSLWMTEKRKWEELEKTTDDQMKRQQQQLQMQRESNARQLKELQDTIAKQKQNISDQRTEILGLRKKYQGALDGKESECQRLKQQLKEVSGRLEEEIKVSVAEQKRREMAEAKLESQTEKMKHLDAQHQDTVRQLDVLKTYLADRTKAQAEEQSKFDSVEKHYKETLERKDKELEKLERRLVDMNILNSEITEYETKEAESEKRKNKILEKKIKENEERELKLKSELQQQLTKLNGSVDQLKKSMKDEKRKMIEVERERDHALALNELSRQKFHKDLTDLSNRFESKSIALNEEKQRRQTLEKQLKEQKEIECEKAKAMETERQLANTREQLESQTQLLAREKEKRRTLCQKLNDQKKRQLETEEEHKKQLKELKERLSTQQTPGAKDDMEGGGGGGGGGGGKTGRDEWQLDGSQRSKRGEDAILGSGLSMELSVVREKLERATEELERERETRLNIQEQNRHLMAEKNRLMEKVTEEKGKLMGSRKTDVGTEKRSRSEKSVNQDDKPHKRNESHSKILLIPETMHLDDQSKRISQLSEALKEEKLTNLRLTIQRRHMRSERDEILQQLQFIQQKDGMSHQLPCQQQTQNAEPPTKVAENREEKSTDSREKVQLDRQANWTLEKKGVRKGTTDGKAAIEEERRTSECSVNVLRLDENEIQELRHRVKYLHQQQLEDKAETAVIQTGSKENDSEEEERQQQYILTKIKEEPLETKDSQTEVETLSSAEDPPPPTKRRRLNNSISIEDTNYYIAPFDQLITGCAKVIEIKPESNINEEPIEKQVLRTPITTVSKDEIKEPGQRVHQERKEEQGPSLRQEPRTVPVVINRKRLLSVPSTYTPTLIKSSASTITDAQKTNACAAKDVASTGSTESVVQSSPEVEEEARLVKTLRPHSLKTLLTGVAVLNGSLFIVSEMNSVIEVYDSTTFTFSGRVSVEDLTNPQFLTSCPLNSCLYILNRAKPSNAIYRLKLAPHWLHHKWLIGTDFGALASTSSGSLLLSCFDLRIKEFSSSGKLIRQFQFGQATLDLRLYGAIQLTTTTKTYAVTSATVTSAAGTSAAGPLAAATSPSGTSAAGTSAAGTEASQFVISYSNRITGLKGVCTIDSDGQVLNPLLQYKGCCTSQHLIIGRQSGCLFLADFGMGEVFQWNAQLKNCRTIRRRKKKEDSGFRPMRICLDQNDRRIFIAEVSLDNHLASKISIYDL